MSERFKQRIITSMNVRELEGAKLHYWVAKANGGMTFDGPFNPSTEWNEGGPIIERNNISLHPPYTDRPAIDEWLARCWGADDDKDRRQYASYEGGPTALIAAMRAFVAYKIGEEVPAL